MVSILNSSEASVSQRSNVVVRLIGWQILTFFFAFFLNNALVIYFDLQSVPATSTAFTPRTSIQTMVYVLCFGWTAWMVMRDPNRSLRRDANSISNFNAYFVRGCFFSVLFIGLADATIAWIRVESLLPVLFNEYLAAALLRANFVGPVVHGPLLLLGFVTALFTRTLGFIWLSLMIVGAELLIVISRFVFSYEQSLMGDLVRYWYAALFLFASAYTLLEEGHVRVDIAYAGMSQRNKARVNAYGALFLGMVTATTIFLICLWSKQSIVTSPVLNFEVSQTGTAGMYTKYQMAAFLLIFAITMQFQFVSQFFDAVADMKNEPGKRSPEPISH